MQINIPEPNEKQRPFLQSKKRFVGYGGSRGGGKSWAVRLKAALLAANFDGIKILILRRTYPDLRENHIIPMAEMLYGAARYRDNEKVFIFPNGSRIKFGYCDNERDLLQYQGREYDVMFIDEATQIPEEWFKKLTASVRGTNSFPKRVYLTCNPGGVGHAWVKRLFIDKRYTDGENPDDYEMIYAKVYDNAALMREDPGYVRFLQGLPDGLREAWLEGNWDVFVGQYFSEFNRDVHVIKPFEPPAHWRRYVTMDYGLDMLAAYCVAMDEHENAYVYREVYESGLVVSDAAARIKGMTGEGEDIYAYYAPPDLWNRHSDSGQSTAELFAMQGIGLVKAANERVQGWHALKEWLKPYADEQGRTVAHLRIFENCANLIRTLPALQYDDKRPGDCAREPHELTHAPDSLRYFVAGRPLPTELPVVKGEDDIDFDDEVDELLAYGQ